MDFLHELKVKRFDAVAGGGDEEEASMDLMMVMVMMVMMMMMMMVMLAMQGNMVASLPALGKEWTITFDLAVSKLPTEYA